MREFQERKKAHRLLYSKKVLFLLLLILGFLIFSTAKVFLKSRNVLSKSEETRKELAELERTKAELEEDVGQLKKESGIEEEIRKKFDVQKPGEKVAVIIDKSQENGKMDSGQESSNLFQKFWQWIKEKF